MKPVLSGPHIEWTCSIIGQQLEFQNFPPIYCKINLHSVATDTNIKPFCCKIPAIGRHLIGFVLLKAQLRLISQYNVHLYCFKAKSRLFKIDASTDWTLCYEQFLIIHCVTLCYKRVTKPIIAWYVKTCLEPTPCTCIKGKLMTVF